MTRRVAFLGRLGLWLVPVVGLLGGKERKASIGERRRLFTTSSLPSSRSSSANPSSCWFKNDSRLLCHYYGTDIAVGTAFTVSRLLAVNIDGKEQKVLVQNGRAGSSQFQDRIVDPLRNDPRNVLIEHGDHSLSKPEMRLTLFQNLEQFLAAHLPAK